MGKLDDSHAGILADGHCLLYRDDVAADKEIEVVAAEKGCNSIMVGAFVMERADRNGMNELRRAAAGRDVAASNTAQAGSNPGRFPPPSRPSWLLTNGCVFMGRGDVRDLVGANGRSGMGSQFCRR